MTESNHRAVTVPIPNGLLFVHDRDHRDIPTDVVLYETSGADRLLILSVCNGASGDTRIVLSRSDDPAGEGEPFELYFDGPLRVPSGEIVLSTCLGETVLACQVACPSVRLRAWGDRASEADAAAHGGILMPVSLWIRVDEVPAELPEEVQGAMQSSGVEVDPSTKKSEPGAGSQEASCLVRDGVLYLRDGDERSVPVSENEMFEAAIAGCVMPLPARPEHLGETRIVLSKHEEPDPGDDYFHLTGSIELRVPSGRLVITIGAGEDVLSCDVGSSEVLLKSWMGGKRCPPRAAAMDEPPFIMLDSVWVRVIELRDR